MGKFEFIKENLDETVFVFALFKCRKFDKRRNQYEEGIIYTYSFNI